MTKNLVSIILPVYNTEKYLKLAIESILSQSHNNFELIIIDDGSTDNTLEIITSFKDHRIILLKNTINEGIVKSLNKGISIAKGHYIARMDADDIAHPRRIEIQINYLKKNPTTKILGTCCQVINESGKVINKINMPLSWENIKIALLFTCPIIHPTIMFDSEIKNEFIYDQDFLHTEDWYLWTQLAYKYKVENLKTHLLKYRIHSNKISITKKTFIQLNIEKMQRFLFQEKMRLKLEKIHLITSAPFYFSTAREIKNTKSVSNWLRKLINHNEKYNIFSSHHFKKQTAAAWFRYCHALINQSNLNIIYKFYQSKLVWNLSFSKHCYFWLVAIYKILIVRKIKKV